jgi:hypothetical protein
LAAAVATSTRSPAGTKRNPAPRSLPYNTECDNSERYWIPFEHLLTLRNLQQKQWKLTDYKRGSLLSHSAEEPSSKANAFVCKTEYNY